MDLMKLLQEGDSSCLEMEKARRTLEEAKASVERAKNNFDECKVNFENFLARCEEAGHGKNKLRKVIEERTGALMSSGLIGDDVDMPVKIVKSPKLPRKTKPKAEETIENFDNSTDEEVQSGPAN